MSEIEIRKQSNQFIIGRIPSWIVRWGNVVILAICLLLLYISFNLKFPLTVTGHVQIVNDSIYLIIPRVKQSLIRENQAVNLRMDDYPYMDYGVLKGKISSITNFIQKENTVHLPVILSDELNTVDKSDLISGMSGVGDIIIEQIPVIYRIIKTK